MATTSIWAIQGGASAIERLEAYIENPEKTCTPRYLEAQQSLHVLGSGKAAETEFETDELKEEIACYVTGINCNAPNDAWQEMASVYQCYDKPCQGRVCYHGYQSFRENEVTAEQAHAIGVELAQRLWGDRFQVVVATHMNTGHYHNHFLLNAISFADGLKYDNRKSDYQAMRTVSDEICRRYGISVIEKPKAKTCHSYAAWKAGNQIRADMERALKELTLQRAPPADAARKDTNGAAKTASATRQPNRTSARQDVRQDMDEAVRLSSTMQEFVQTMESYVYVWNFNGKYPRILAPGRERFFRLTKLGDGYDSLEVLAKRVMDMQDTPALPKIQQTHFRYHGSFQKKPKAHGLLALYYRRCFQLGAFRRRQYVKYTPAYWQATKQLRSYTKAAVFLHGTGIRTIEELTAFRQNVCAKWNQCSQEIALLNRKLAESDSPEENKRLLARLETEHAKEKQLNEQLSLCRLVEQQQEQPMQNAAQTDQNLQR